MAFKYCFWACDRTESNEYAVGGAGRNIYDSAIKTCSHLRGHTAERQEKRQRVVPAFNTPTLGCAARALQAGDAGGAGDAADLSCYKSQA